MITRVYKNLHRDCYSVLTKRRDCDDEPLRWLLYKHCNNLILANCRFHVREGGRQRVIKQRKKNVHAFIEGEIKALNVSIYSLFGENYREEIDKKIAEGTIRKISYNPYDNSSFVDADGNPVYYADRVIFTVFGVFII